MAYTKQTWNTGDIITAEKLNHIEDGIGASGSASLDGGIPDFFYGTGSTEGVGTGGSVESGLKDFKTVTYSDTSNLESGYSISNLEYFIPWVKNPEASSPTFVLGLYHVLNVNLGFYNVYKNDFFPLNNTSTSCDFKIWYVERTDPSEWSPQYLEGTLSYSSSSNYWAYSFTDSDPFTLIIVKYDSEAENFKVELTLTPKTSEYDRWSERILLGMSLKVSKDSFTKLGYVSGSQFIIGYNSTNDLFVNLLISPYFFRAPKEVFPLSNLYSYSMNGLNWIEDKKNLFLPDYSGTGFKEASGSRPMILSSEGVNTLPPYAPILAYKVPFTFTRSIYTFFQTSMNYGRLKAIDGQLQSEDSPVFMLASFPIGGGMPDIPDDVNKVVYYGYVESPTKGKILFEFLRDYVEESLTNSYSGARYTSPEADILALKTKGKEVCSDGTMLYLCFCEFTKNDYSGVSSSKTDTALFFYSQMLGFSPSMTFASYVDHSTIHFSDETFPIINKGFYYPEGNTNLSYSPEGIWFRITNSLSYAISLEETT